MKKKLGFLTACLLSAAMLVGCGSNSGGDFSDKPYVEFNDGEVSFQYEVSDYGKEFTLPASENKESGFYGWLGMDGLHQVGDKAIAEEFMSFTAVRSSPEYGTLVALDTTRGGYMIMCGEEPMQLDSPYMNFSQSDYDDFFDHWVDEDGNTYEDDAIFTINKGEVFVIEAVYSKDYTKANKIDVYYNTGVDMDYEFHSYAKKGAEIQLYTMIEPADCTFEGWYDAQEGGNFIANAEDFFTPTSDLTLYAHWSK